LTYNSFSRWKLNSAKSRTDINPLIPPIINTCVNTSRRVCTRCILAASRTKIQETGQDGGSSIDVPQRLDRRYSMHHARHSRLVYSRRAPYPHRARIRIHTRDSLSGDSDSEKYAAAWTRARPGAFLELTVGRWEGNCDPAKFQISKNQSRCGNRAYFILCTRCT